MAVSILNLVATLSPTARTTDIVLTWDWGDVDDDADSVKIMRGTDGVSYSLYAIIPIEDVWTSRTYTDTGCAANTRYYYKARATQIPIEWSTPADTWTAPGTPVDFDTSLSETTVTLTWTQVGVPTSVYYYKKIHSYSTWQSGVAVTYPTATADVTGLSEATAYDFRLSAYNSTSGLYSDYTDILTETVQLKVPTNFVATCSAGDIVLSWTDNSSAESGYEVYRKVSGGSYGSALSTTATSPYTDSTVSAGTTYDYKIRAQASELYYSVYSDEVEITAGDPPASTPGTPTCVASGQTSMSLTWTKGATADYDEQHIWRSLDDSDYEDIDTVSNTAESYEDTGLTSYTQYYYKIVSYNDYGYTASASGNAYTDADVDPPTDIVVTSYNATTLTLTWTNNSADADYIYIERRVSGGSYSAITESPVAGDAVTVNSGGLTADVEYTFRLRAYHTASTTYGSYSVPVTASLEASETGSVQKNSVYIAFGNSICVVSTTPENSFECIYTTKPLDFTDNDASADNTVKTVDKVQIEYVDKYASVPLTVRMSNDNGITWPATYTRTRSIGTGSGYSKTVDYTFLPLSGRNITVQLRWTSASAGLTITGVRIYYYLRSEYIEV